MLLYMMTKRRTSKSLIGSLIILGIMMLSISGCKKNLRQQSISPQSPPIYPTTIINIPTPLPQTGAVTGQLLTPNEQGRPYISILYLGNVIRPINDSSAMPLISFSEESSIRGVQDQETGRFYFLNVPPGEYAIIIWTPVMSMPLRDPVTKQEIIFRVEPDKITDLGTIIIP